jgi:hypothetical protein
VERAAILSQPGILKDRGEHGASAVRERIIFANADSPAYSRQAGSGSMPRLETAACAYHWDMRKSYMKWTGPTVWSGRLRATAVKSRLVFSHALMRRTVFLRSRHRLLVGQRDARLGSVLLRGLSPL